MQLSSWTNLSPKTLQPSYTPLQTPICSHLRCQAFQLLIKLTAITHKNSLLVEEIKREFLPDKELSRPSVETTTLWNKLSHTLSHSCSRRRRWPRHPSLLEQRAELLRSQSLTCHCQELQTNSHKQPGVRLEDQQAIEGARGALHLMLALHGEEQEVLEELGLLKLDQTLSERVVMSESRHRPHSLVCQTSHARPRIIVPQQLLPNLSLSNRMLHQGPSIAQTTRRTLSCDGPDYFFIL